MLHQYFSHLRRLSFVLIAILALFELPIFAASNVVVRIMAANLTGNSQKYEPEQIRLFQGLKPDVVAIQEFNYGSSSIGEIRTFINTAFGTNFEYYREDSSYQIPNGVVSRYPIISSGHWIDTVQGSPNRGFAWARIDLPGTNDLYVVSVHLLTTSSANRSMEATLLKSHIQTNFPANAWIVVGGDFNTDTRGEDAVDVFTTFLSDSPIPTDAVTGGNEDTNLNRNKPYDYLLPSFSLSSRLTNVVFASHSFPKGLVFDTREYSPLSDVPPILSGDSLSSQHMPVIKDFLIPVVDTDSNAPAITAQPQGLTIPQGSNALFTVTATGTAPLSYQWRFGSTNIGGATASSYTRLNAQTNDAGDYTVVVTNSAGSVTSSNATLTVTRLPFITSQPQSTNVFVGGNATFTVIAGGEAPLSYQWQFASTNIGGATASTYTRVNAQLADAGIYTVVVTNAAGSVTSSNATLTVNTVPVGGTATNIVISQIYGGGGNTGATYKNDFVELFNPTANTVTVSGWSVRYASSSGNSWSVVNLTGSIQGYHYYLVQLGSTTSPGDGITLPAVNATGSANISAANGKLALLNNQTALAVSSPVGLSQLIDFVGFGTANASEGSGAAPAGNNTASILRKNGGYTDANNNVGDFITLTPPAPRNAATPANPPASTPAIAPTLSLPAFAADQFTFTLTGSVGSNYVIQASTNLTTTNWISLRTNPAPFGFTQTNATAFPQQFYRAIVAP